MDFSKLLIVEPSKTHYEYAEYVMSQCADCGYVGRNKVGNLISRYKAKGFPWVCGVCQKKRASEAAKIREAKYTPEEKTRKAKLALEQFRRKTGLNNPMDLAGIREKQKQANNTTEFRNKSTERNNRLNTDPIYKQRLSDGQHRRIQENPKAAAEQTKKMLDASRSKEARAKAGISIAKIFKEQPERMRPYLEAGRKWSADPELKFERYRRLQESNRSKDFTSKGERELLKAIQQLFPEARRSFVGNREVDVLIPSKKIAIEYHGCYWHSEKRAGRSYHYDKMKTCESQGVRLIQIFDFEWESRRHQIMDLIKSALGVNQRVFARKCRVVTVERKKAVDFLEKNHIQGSLRHGLSLCLGLENEGRLVALATFGRHHRGREQWVLNRFCCEHGVNVVGGLSRLSKHASRILDSDLISWADLRYSQGKGYESAGWEREEILKPDYFYWKDDAVWAKQSRMKSKVGTPEGMTEAEHAELEGFERVWDCGKARYRFRRTASRRP